MTSSCQASCPFIISFHLTFDDTKSLIKIFIEAFSLISRLWVYAAVCYEPLINTTRHWFCLICSLLQLHVCFLKCLTFFKMSDIWFINSWNKTLRINQYQACLYLFECISHDDSKYGHEIPKCCHFLTFCEMFDLSSAYAPAWKVLIKPLGIDLVWSVLMLSFFFAISQHAIQLSMWER